MHPAPANPTHASQTALMARFTRIRGHLLQVPIAMTSIFCVGKTLAFENTQCCVTTQYTFCGPEANASRCMQKAAQAKPVRAKVDFFRVLSTPVHQHGS